MIVTTPSSNDTTVKNIFKQNPSIKVDSGCTVEYNINSMISDISISVTPTDTDSSFLKFFKNENLIKPNRPECAGVKYYVLGDTSITSNSYSDNKAVYYPSNSRLYIPGINTKYNYYLAPLGQGKTISFTYSRNVLVNKVIVKFEISHSIPPTFEIRGTSGGVESSLKSGTSANIKPFPANLSDKTFDEGTVAIYYTGTTWSFTESDLNTSAYVQLTNLKLIFGGVTGKYVGLIEVAPIMVKDISDSIVSFDIKKESSSSEDDLLPVGYISANSLILNINDYNKDLLTVVSYIKSSTTLENNKIYLYKYAKLKPYIKVFHSAGTYGAVGSKYDKIIQGTYFMDSWSISEYGETSITALDGAKILQETICPEILCRNFPASAIIRTVLDTIGFTNYKINIKDPIGQETSIIKPTFWWSEDTKTVWQVLQELCKDTQMTAVFDESNILQFYSRDYLYDTTRGSSWTFSNVIQNTVDLPNIISMDKIDLPSVNKVKVEWQSAVSSIYTGDASSLWSSPDYYLGAFSLQESLPSSSGPGSYLMLEAITTDSYSETAYSFSGYLLINSEIIEYDAIQYQYRTINSPDNAPVWIKVDILNEGDVYKYLPLSKVGYEIINGIETACFRPTGGYRIKQRGALGTTIPLNHPVNPQDILSGWTTLNEIKWKDS